MPSKKKWTLMFYLASDNPLAPSVVSQLKSIKAAGFHKDANVIVQFDPQNESTPTHIFDVNVIKKAESKKQHSVGFKANDPSVHNLLEDKLWHAEKDRKGQLIREHLMGKYEAYNPGTPPNGNGSKNGHTPEPGPQKSLGKFLRFCAKSYPASHYVLFLLGHGTVVGNDVFMYDQHAEEHTLSLGGLRTVLNDFNARIGDHGGSLELISFHSCSVSSLEVAYELKDQAKYMLASQGSTLVGNWPYRQILIRIFNQLVKQDKRDKPIQRLFEDIFSYCVQNSTDFLLAGYPFDLCLCDLGEIGETKAAIEELSAALIKGLECEPLKESILLAHLESQSFYQEMYSDVVDFCRCLYQRITKPLDSVFEQERADIKDAIEKVNEAIRKSVVRSDFAGPEYQYARGLSLYFPWSRPIDEFIDDQYAGYRFVRPSPEHSTWRDFLKKYFNETRRKPIGYERVNPIPELNEEREPASAMKAQLFEDQVAVVYGQAAQFGGLMLDDNRPEKTDTSDPLGGTSILSIKNFPRDTRRLTNRKRPRKDDRFPVGCGLLQESR